MSLDVPAEISDAKDDVEVVAPSLDAENDVQVFEDYFGHGSSLNRYELVTSLRRAARTSRKRDNAVTVLCACLGKNGPSFTAKQSV